VVNVSGSLMNLEKVMPTDTDRLDWLVAGAGKDKAARVMGSDERGYAVCDCSNGLTFLSRDHRTYREAIDAAMLRTGLPNKPIGGHHE